jgi:hypothetical protein
VFERYVLTRKLAERLGIELPGTRRLLLQLITSVTQHFPSPFFSSCCGGLNDVFGVAVLLEKVSDKLEIGYLEHTNKDRRQFFNQSLECQSRNSQFDRTTEQKLDPTSHCLNEK